MWQVKKKKSKEQQIAPCSNVDQLLSALFLENVPST